MRVLLAALVVALSFATPAFAADEEPPPDPRTGGPLVVIPVEIDNVAELVVTDVSFEPTAGLAPGSSVRLRAQLAAGAAPGRTVIVVENVGEIDGDVAVAADGAIDTEFVLPSDLEPGEYPLFLAATGLGRAPIGVIDVVAVEEPAAPAPAATGGIEEPAEETTTSAQPADEPAAVAPTPGTSTGIPLPLVLAGVALAGLVSLLVLLGRRRQRAVATFAATTSLPTATALPGQHDSAAKPEELSVPLDVAAPEPAAPAEPAAPGDPANPAEAAEPIAPADSENPFHVVELTAGPDAASPPTERILGSFADVDAAKASARDTHRANNDKTQERWWEVRPAGKGAVWMVHAWALREYDIDDATGHASSTQR